MKKETVPLRERNPEELAARSELILNDPHVHHWVETSCSATALRNIVKRKTGDEDKAKAARCLFFLKEKHPMEYKKLLESHKKTHKTEDQS